MILLALIVVLLLLTTYVWFEEEMEEQIRRSRHESSGAWRGEQRSPTRAACPPISAGQGVSVVTTGSAPSPASSTGRDAK